MKDLPKRWVYSFCWEFENREAVRCKRVSTYMRFNKGEWEVKRERVTAAPLTLDWEVMKFRAAIKMTTGSSNRLTVATQLPWWAMGQKGLTTWVNWDRPPLDPVMGFPSLKILTTLLLHFYNFTSSKIYIEYLYLLDKKKGNYLKILLGRCLNYAHNAKDILHWTMSLKTFGNT